MKNTIRVLSYNIHKGFTVASRGFVLRAIKEAIHSVDADIIFLQEVIGEHAEFAKRHAEWPSTSQFEYLADKVWPHHAYGKNSVFTEGHHGNALLSKHNIIEWSNEDVSTNKIEKRGLLHVTLKLPGSDDPLHCICVHLGLTRPGRKAQLEKLCQKIDRSVPHGAPLLIAGDFNDWALTASKVLKNKLDVVEVHKHRKGRHAATFPSFFPFLHLDRIYTRGFEVVEAKVMRGKNWRRLSDHAALYAELTISTE